MAAFPEDINTFENGGTGNSKTLCDWVKNFRIKKIQMKRKLRTGGDLRICAILTTTLINAEEQLRHKQQERFNRWSEIQSKYGYFNNKINGNNEIYNYNSTTNNTYRTNTSCASEVREYLNNNKNGLTLVSDEVLNNDSQENFTDSLWKYELSGLDDFMKNLSSNKCR